MNQKTGIKIHQNVKLGKNVKLEPGTIIGLPPYNRHDGELQTIIGDNAHIRHNTIIYAGVKIGKDFQTGPNVLIRENNTIGNNVVVWHGATLNPGNIIGNNSRIHAGCFLEMVTLGQNVFVGPSVTFTDDPHPLIPINSRECWKGATIEDGAVIGANTTLLPHIHIGKATIVGAGSVVVENIPDNKVVVGNPAKIIKESSEVVCKKGPKLHYPYRKD